MLWSRVFSSYQSNPLLVMSEDHGPDPPPEAREAIVRESSRRPRSRVKQIIRKFAKGVIRKLSKFFKYSRSRVPRTQNVNLQDTSSNQNIENTPHTLPSTDDNHPTTAENPSIQGTSGEPASKVLDISPGVEETPGPKSVGAEIQDAHEASEHMKTFGERAQSVMSAARNAPAGLAVVDEVPTNYLRPLKIFDSAIEKIANVWNVPLNL
ncbi:hypothetical protein BDR06DRAFT_1059651 [Suillus hirtellus]|nr:hypothetical protein BDR06DRAFT_1059651 [Suillus hirtellus]